MMRLIVTHGGPIRVHPDEVFAREKEFWSWKIPHGTGYRLEWESEQAFKEGKHARLIGGAHNGKREYVRTILAEQESRVV